MENSRCPIVVRRKLCSRYGRTTSRAYKAPLRRMSFALSFVVLAKRQLTTATECASHNPRPEFQTRRATARSAVVASRSITTWFCSSSPAHVPSLSSTHVPSSSKTHVSSSLSLPGPGNLSSSLGLYRGGSKPQHCLPAWTGSSAVMPLSAPFERKKVACKQPAERERGDGSHHGAHLRFPLHYYCERSNANIERRVHRKPCLTSFGH